MTTGVGVVPSSVDEGLREKVECKMRCCAGFARLFRLVAKIKHLLGLRGFYLKVFLRFQVYFRALRHIDGDGSSSRRESMNDLQNLVGVV